MTLVIRQRPTSARHSVADEALPRLIHRLAVLLGAGLSPASAWRHLAAAGRDAHPLVGAVAEHPALVRDPAEAMAAASGDPPVEWRALTAAWRIAATAGAPLSAVLRSIADALRDRADARREIAVALAAPRATARLVLWLPAAGMLLALLIGVDVVATVVNPIGLVSVVAGLGLVHAGRRWTSRLLAEAEPPPPTAGLGFELLAVAAAGGRGPEAALQLVVEHLTAVDCAPSPSEGYELTELVTLSRQSGAPLGELARAEAREARVA
ncbi:MAG: type II secretion system F family protein, partial [Microcella sp.]